jgi:hypothetical protein
VWHLGTSLPGMPLADQNQYLWCVDTFWTHILNGTSPFWTDRVLYPLGANLMHTGLAPFVSMFALPFRSHLVLYLALAVLASLVAGALGMRALVRRLTGSELAGFLAGCLYAFSPTVLSFADASHYYKVVSAALLPWGLYALVGFIRSPRARALVAVSAVTWCLLFTDYYETILFVVIVAVVLLLSLRREYLAPAAVDHAVNEVIAAALIIRVFPSLDTTELIAGGDYFWRRSTINLADLFVPSSYNPLLGRFGELAFDRPNGDVDSYYLGFGVLALAALAFGRGRPRVTVPLAVAGLLAAALACGINPRFGAANELVPERWMPWYWLVRLPSLNLLDLPRCFILGTQLVLATLAGIGIARLLARGVRPAAVVAVVLAVFAVEYGQLGMRLYTPEVPLVYRRLAAMPDRTLLELPSGVTESKMVFGYDLSRPSNNEQMFLQTVHRKRRVGAYLSRVPRSAYRWFESQPVINDIFLMTNPVHEPAPWIWGSTQVTRLPDYPAETVDRFLATFDLGYVLLQPNERQPMFAEGIDRLLAGRIKSRSKDPDGFILYVVDRDGTAQASVGGAPAEGAQKAQ